MFPDTTFYENIDIKKMSVAKLEQLVTFIVKSSCLNDKSNHITDKPNWWPTGVAFTYPIKRERSTDLEKWRESLLDIIEKNYIHRKRICFNNGRLIRSVTKLNGMLNGKEKVIKQVPYPVVKLCDVLKCEIKSDKNEFLNYFNLSEKKDGYVIYKNNYKTSHPFHLLNTHNVPFSSDLGRKMTKEYHKAPPEVHEKKLERLERYLTTDNIQINKNINYEISYNKNTDCNHTYVFPNKKYHKKDSLPPKVKFLLKYCKPCTIKLENLNLPHNYKRKLVVSKENVPKHKNSLKENINDLSKKNTLKRKRTNCKQYSIRHSHVLVPKNDNLVKKDILNASVVLTPLNPVFNRKNKKIYKKKIKRAINNYKGVIYHRRSPLKYYSLRNLKK